MNWQEYQDAVSDLYAQLGDGGVLKRNIFLPDKHTGKKRQVDAWLEVVVGDHVLHILIDAKYHKEKLDVKNVEEVFGLAEAVGADKAFIVCSFGWSKAAEEKARFLRMDLRLFRMEEAVEFLNPDTWAVCEICNNDCIIMNHDGSAVYDGLVLWWLAGTCRECGSARIWCQDCGDKVYVKKGDKYTCNCGHRWGVDNEGVSLKMKGYSGLIRT